MSLSEVICRVDVLHGGGLDIDFGPDWSAHFVERMSKVLAQVAIGRPSTGPL
jgi:hypothetical protein